MWITYSDDKSYDIVWYPYSFFEVSIYEIIVIIMIIMIIITI